MSDEPSLGDLFAELGRAVGEGLAEIGESFEQAAFALTCQAALGHILDDDRGEARQAIVEFNPDQFDRLEAAALALADLAHEMGAERRTA